MDNKSKLKEMLYGSRPKPGAVAPKENSDTLAKLLQQILMELAELRKSISGNKLDLGNIPQLMADFKQEFVSSKNDPKNLRTLDLMGDMVSNTSRLIELYKTPAADNSSTIISEIRGLQNNYEAAHSALIKSLKTEVFVGGGMSGGYLNAVGRSVTSVVPTQVSVGVTSVTVASENKNRKRIIIQNSGTTIIYLSLSSTAPTTSIYSVALPACTAANDGSGGMFIDEMWQGIIKGIGSAVSGTVVVTEIN